MFLFHISNFFVDGFGAIVSFEDLVGFGSGISFEAGRGTNNKFVLIGP